MPDREVIVPVSRRAGTVSGPPPRPGACWPVRYEDGARGLLSEEGVNPYRHTPAVGETFVSLTYHRHRPGQPRHTCHAVYFDENRVPAELIAAFAHLDTLAPFSL